VALHVVDWEGGDPPLLAIHGSTMSGCALTALCEQLAPRVRVVGFSMGGAIDDQLRAAPHGEPFVARRSDHTKLVRDPEAELVEAILGFARRCRAGAGAAQAR
jgi:hypothetical protein